MRLDGGAVKALALVHVGSGTLLLGLSATPLNPALSDTYC